MLAVRVVAPPHTRCCALAVVPQYALGGSELDGARLDAQLAFPAQIKKVLTQLRVGPPGGPLEL